MCKENYMDKSAAILRVDNANPLILKGMEESDLF